MKYIPAAVFATALWLLPFAATAEPLWIGSWASSQQIPEPANALPSAALEDATLRQIVHLSLGGQSLRVRLSNAFGTAPLHITGVHIARPLSPASPELVAGSDIPVTFAGAPDITIPAGADYISDPIAFDAAPGSDLAVSMHFDHAPAQQTSHPGSRSTSYLVHGDQVSAPDLPRAQTFDHWFNLSGVEIPVTRSDESVVVTLGDSITDGHGATTNGNDRWPDDLARRLMGAGMTRSVLNRGIGGGRILLDGLGPNALARFDRDVLAEPGVHYLIILEGINDIGTFDRAGTLPPAAHAHLVADLTGAYAQMVMRAHSAGIKVYGATLTPFADSPTYKPHPLSEADRIALNDWIRAPGHVDAVIDFDKAIRDPASPGHMMAAYDSGDHLHPSAAGYHAMADAIPLGLFAP
ncbi:MAG TPA: SGNH/GDSL hydrolase family protein [Rhizomicrobium sp.]|jgi:lysophospholipase L1-like esterase|nr:SGNH/GDSL hydrolase family protein [Rhizomicrobium sp.]